MAAGVFHAVADRFLMNEALFAELKQQMKLRRVRLRRLWNVAEQFHLAATAQNLKRLVHHLAQKQSPTLTTT
jgi:IS5 family transposase